MIQQANLRDFAKLYRISRNNAAAVHKQQVDILSISCKLAATAAAAAVIRANDVNWIIC